ncbi:MAG: Uma2 family endonuclease [Cyclobacteriaceae bacterium]|nr:Uma2 family endonuclease [Cyclobacteriaceae bacterium]
MLPEGTLAEVIENQLYMAPSPTPFHQEASGNLFTDINVFVRNNELGKVFIAPLDLYLDENSNVVQPDILFVSRDNPLIIDRKGLTGVPDLIIEVLSPGNRNYDSIKKKNLYEKFGVTEYWTVDPETKKANGFLLNKGQYVSQKESHHQLHSHVLNQTFSF